jgi:hypothetical protein
MDGTCESLRWEYTSSSSWDGGRAVSFIRCILPVHASKLVARPGIPAAKIPRFILAIAFIALFSPAEAHDWYAGIRNPQTGWGCCGGQDCHPIDVGRVEETATEFIVDGKWHFIKDEAMPAQDGQYHACIWGGKPRCFFYPMNV